MTSSSFSNKGFTLVEILIVIGILGVLLVALVVAANPIENIRKASDIVVINDISALSRGAEAYATSHNGFYPATLEDLKNSDEVRIEENQPEGYDPYEYQSFPSGCVSGVSCTAITISGELKGHKYNALPYVKFDSQEGKVCFVVSPSNSCN